MTELVEEWVDTCVGCPPELGGCIGTLCPNYPHIESQELYFCDACGDQVERADQLYRAPNQTEEAWICERCLDELECMSEEEQDG